MIAGSSPVRQGRGAAVVSDACNSNSLSSIVGANLPTLFIAPYQPSDRGLAIAIRLSAGIEAVPMAAMGSLPAEVKLLDRYFNSSCASEQTFAPHGAIFPFLVVGWSHVDRSRVAMGRRRCTDAGFRVAREMERRRQLKPGSSVHVRLVAATD
ncbi:MAG: hypothetical protein ABI277_13690 [Burkholderiaceae bacterium]